IVTITQLYERQLTPFLRFYCGIAEKDDDDHNEGKTTCQLERGAEERSGFAGNEHGRATGAQSGHQRPEEVVEPGGTVGCVLELTHAVDHDPARAPLHELGDLDRDLVQRKLDRLEVPHNER